MNTIWRRFKKRQHSFEQDRLLLIDMSHTIARNAKRFIHSLLHKTTRRELEELQGMRDVVKKLLHLLEKDPYLYQVGALSEGLEEYVEAVFFHAYVTEIDVDATFLPSALPHEAVIGGIADASGEVVRHVRAHLDLSHAEHAYHHVSDLYKHFLDIEISRNNKLRAKMGDVHRNMLQLEDIIFNLKLKMEQS